MLQWVRRHIHLCLGLQGYELVSANGVFCDDGLTRIGLVHDDEW